MSAAIGITIAILEDMGMSSKWCVLRQIHVNQSMIMKYMAQMA